MVKLTTIRGINGNGRAEMRLPVLLAVNPMKLPKTKKNT
jgi:hypothetical protein